MIRVGLIGLGGMGRGHFNVYKKLMEEGYPIELVALCDIDEAKFGEAKTDTNLEEFKSNNKFNFHDFHLYTDVDEMLDKENLDVVSIVTPTYEHCALTMKCLKKGINVLCEKPMALSVKHCQLMIDTAKETGKKLMIGQCLRFSPEYRFLKETVENGTFGKVFGAFLYRGGSPTETFWFRNREKGGGALFDQHIHDVDMVNWLFGMPKAVQSVGVSAMDGSGYDMVSTNYIYDNNIMINTQNRWIDYEAVFEYGYRITFEKGSIIRDENGIRAFDKNGNNVTPDNLDASPYYNEIKAFCDAIINNTPIPQENTPESTMDTIRIALAETESCDLGGAIVTLE